MTAHITQWIADLGLAGVFALMAIDAVLPAGGELVMLFAGALAAGAIAGHDASSLPAAIAAGTLGYLAGSLAGWAIGRVGGRPFIERHGRWLHLGPPRFRRAERWFARYGSAFVLFGRLTPLVRSFVSIPAGALEYPFPRYVGADRARVADLVRRVRDRRLRARHALGQRPQRVPLRRLRGRRRARRARRGAAVPAPVPHGQLTARSDANATRTAVSASSSVAPVREARSA